MPRLSSQKLDQNRAHIIASHFLARLLSDHKIKQVHHNGQAFNSRLSLIGDPRDQRLAVVDVALPDAIAAHDYELILAWLSGDFGDIGFAYDELLVVGFVFLSLVVEVP